MSQQEEDVLSLEDSGSEYFDTAEAGSSADEMEDGPLYQRGWRWQRSRAHPVVRYRQGRRPRVVRG